MRQTVSKSGRQRQTGSARSSQVQRESVKHSKQLEMFNQRMLNEARRLNAGPCRDTRELLRTQWVGASEVSA